MTYIAIRYPPCQSSDRPIQANTPRATALLVPAYWVRPGEFSAPLLEPWVRARGEAAA